MSRARCQGETHPIAPPVLSQDSQPQLSGQQEERWGKKWGETHLSTCVPSSPQRSTGSSQLKPFTTGSEAMTRCQVLGLRPAGRYERCGWEQTISGCNLASCKNVQICVFGTERERESMADCFACRCLGFIPGPSCSIEHNPQTKTKYICLIWMTLSQCPGPQSYPSAHHHFSLPPHSQSQQLKDKEASEIRSIQIKLHGCESLHSHPMLKA